MFDKFGIFNSAAELNEAAEGQFNEGDFEALKELAKENGISAEDVQMYMDGDLTELCDIYTAALGKIDVEMKELKLAGIMEDWISYIQVQIMEADEIAIAVRKSDKSLKGCIAELLKWAFKHQVTVDAEILKASGVNAGKVTLGIPNMGEAKRIIREYYR